MSWVNVYIGPKKILNYGLMYTQSLFEISVYEELCINSQYSTKSIKLAPGCFELSGFNNQSYITY